MTGLDAQAQPLVVTDYLDYFGLQDDPFSADLLPFYDGGPRRELFAELLHLCQFSPSLLVVLGEEGVGKRSLKTALCQHFGGQDFICDIDIPVLGNAAGLLETIAQQLAIDEVDTGDIGQAIATIRAEVQTSEDDDSLKVVMIDHAHNLDKESLRVLLRLAAPGEQSPYRQLHLLLFATPDFEQRLPQTDDMLLRVFHLPPLAANEMQHYLRFRLDAVGFSGIFPFKDSDIQFLWDISKGVPGKFHDAAREILIEMALPPPENKSLGVPVTHMAAVVCLLAGLLLVFFYYGANERDANPPPEVSARQEPATVLVSDADNSETTASTETVSAEPLPTQPTAETDTVAAVNNRPTPAPASEDIEQSPAQNLATPTEPATTPDNADTTSKQEDIDALLAAAEEELQQAQTKVKPEPVAKPAAPQANFTADESRLLNRSPDNYTLQILASGSRDAVEDFMARQPNREDLALFTAVREGKTLYIVVMGSFNSSDAARLAVGNLPQEQRAGGPWPRSFQSVQADIRNFRGL